MSKELKVAFVGTGIFATDVHLPTFKKIGYLKPYLAYNRTKAKAETFAEKAGIEKSNVVESLEEVFQNDEVDFVDALLPVQFNLDAVKLAVKYNKPLAFEKPVAANLKQAAEIVKLAEGSDVPIGVLENWAFIKSLSILKEKLPKIGKILGFNYSSTGPWNADNKYFETAWRKNPEHVGGYLSDGGVHQLTLLTGVVGEVESISAYTTQLHEISGDDDTLFSSLKLKNGALGTFTYGSGFGATEKKIEFIIFGQGGSLKYTLYRDDSPTIELRIGTAVQDSQEPEITQVQEVDDYEAEFINFADAVKANDKKLIVVPPRDAFHHLAIVAAAIKVPRKVEVLLK